MSKVVVVNNLTLDGVMQAPGRPDEDTRGGFEHGGWAQPYNDPVMARKMGEGMAAGGPLLFGRRTYQDFASFWPQQKDNPFTPVLDNAQKYVASTTLKEPLPWRNSTAPRGGWRGCRRQTEGTVGPGLGHSGQWRADPIVDATQPHRRVRAPDPPARAGVGSADVPGWQPAGHAPSRRRDPDDDRRRHRDLPHSLRALM